MERSQQLKDIEDTLARQTWYLRPDRYDALFLAGHFEPEPLTMAGRDVEEVVEDIDEIDAYMEQLEEKHSMSGRDLLALVDDDGWV